MSLKKQEFYEGAALHLLVRSGFVTSIQYDVPFFLINEDTVVLLKYSTKTRSPWGFTFTPDEQTKLSNSAVEGQKYIGLICGADGVAALSFDDYLTIANPRNTSIHIACYRNHGKYYDIAGPDGGLNRKVSPSSWQRILDT